MTVRYCTPDWLEGSTNAYRSQPRFQQELAKLTARLCFRIKAEPAWGIDEDITFCAFVNQGELQELAFFSDEDAKKEADFLLAATPQEWKKILRKESKFVTDFMLGKITLEKGSKVGVLGIAPHSNTFVDALTQIELQYPDEMSPEELADYRSAVKEYRRELDV
jgi:hypothetical protein